ncbi:SH2 domain-containing protein 4A isoform X1 [Conger conger]|uniref:SH2 domain-containing protein 4A isoform X1 n=1 Tax=Conger conger TaxID=82655 RepID=UPI002A5A3BBF|nr:SH2 domain-containing protein 4A isoform X1 [Conger conger]
MLQQILKDMYIDPDVLEALNEEQKKTLFLKMRQEQVRRWEEREEKQERDGGLGVRPKPRRAQCKNVSWLLGRDGDVHVCVIGEVDEFKASKLIYSGLGERKGSSVHKNTRCQVDVLKSSLVEHPTSDPVRDERENLPPATPTGIQLNLRENTEELKPAPHLPPLQQPKEVSEAAKPAASLKGPSHGSRPPISSKPCLPNHAPPSVTARLRPHDSPEQHNDKGVARGFRVVVGSRRVGSEGAGLDGDGVQGVARGRVAQLMKNFSAPSNKAPPLSKPPIPGKPAHLHARAPPSVR